MKYDFDTLRGDLFGGVTAMVVALPLSLAYGVAAGMGAAAGLYGAIAVGFFAAFFGGTPTQISGPTAPMTVVMAVIITTYAENLTEALTIVVLGGLLQVLLGVLKFGRFVAYTPYLVVSGFLSGIGVIIIAIQVLPFLGSNPVPGGAVGMVFALPEALDEINSSAFGVGAVTLGAVVFWPQRYRKILPTPLVGLFAGTLVGVAWLNGAPTLGKIPSGLPGLQLGLPSLAMLARAVEPALIFALVGSVVSLLTSLVADSLTRTSHDPDRELIGQGLGNAAAGLIGGLPGCGTPVYTVINIRAGGRTRAAGVIFALLLLATLLGLGPYVESVPFAALSGVLMKVGWDLIDWRLLCHLHRIRREHLFIMLTTLGLTVFVDLITAVAIGLIVSGLAHAGQFERFELDSVVSVPLLDDMFLYGGEDAEGVDPYEARVGMVALRGSFTVASSKKLVRAISLDIKDHEVVIFNFTEATYIDDSAAMVIKQLIDVATEEDTESIILGISGEVKHTLETLNILWSVPEGRIVETLDEARETARALLRD
ncbi:MAG: SulP family inorganic anion transporter [Nitrospinae bacterium]|nr:SulP family inorganic anion transporter [Nitrospinota bacterium]